MASTDRNSDAQKATIPSLFAAVIDDARDLAIGHLQRMQRETSEELGNLKRAILRTAIAVGIMVVGAVLAGHALAAGLVALGLPAWASYAIVTLAAIGGGVVQIKRWPKDSKEVDLIPEESIASLRRDVDRVKHAASAATTA